MHEILKLLEANTRRTLQDIIIGKNFLLRIPLDYSIIPGTDKEDSNNLEILHSKVYRKAYRMRENLCNYTANVELISRNYKELQKLNTKKA